MTINTAKNVIQGFLNGNPYDNSVKVALEIAIEVMQKQIYQEELKFTRNER